MDLHEKNYGIFGKNKQKENTQLARIVFKQIINNILRDNSEENSCLKDIVNVIFGNISIDAMTGVDIKHNIRKITYLKQLVSDNDEFDLIPTVIQVMNDIIRKIGESKPSDSRYPRLAKTITFISPSIANMLHRLKNLESGRFEKLLKISNFIDENKHIHQLILDVKSPDKMKIILNSMFCCLFTVGIHFALDLLLNGKEGANEHKEKETAKQVAKSNYNWGYYNCENNNSNNNNKWEKRKREDKDGDEDNGDKDDDDDTSETDFITSYKYQETRESEACIEKMNKKIDNRQEKYNSIVEESNDDYNIDDDYNMIKQKEMTQTRDDDEGIIIVPYNKNVSFHSNNNNDNDEDDITQSDIITIMTNSDNCIEEKDVIKESLNPPEEKKYNNVYIDNDDKDNISDNGSCCDVNNSIDSILHPNIDIDNILLQNEKKEMEYDNDNDYIPKDSSSSRPNKEIEKEEDNNNNTEVSHLDDDYNMHIVNDNDDDNNKDYRKVVIRNKKRRLKDIGNLKNDGEKRKKKRILENENNLQNDAGQLIKENINITDKEIRFFCEGEKIMTNNNKNNNDDDVFAPSEKKIKKLSKQITKRDRKKGSENGNSGKKNRKIYTREKYPQHEKKCLKGKRKIRDESCLLKKTRSEPELFHSEKDIHHIRKRTKSIDF